MGSTATGLGGQGKSATATTADATAVAALSVGTTSTKIMQIEAWITATNTAGDKYFSAHLGGLFDGTTLLEPVQQIDWHNSANAAAWQADLASSGSNVVVNVTGEASEDITWKVRVNYTIVNAG